jgi:hypothetical protein
LRLSLLRGKKQDLKPVIINNLRLARHEQNSV